MFSPRPQSIGPITSKSGKDNRLATADKFLQPSAGIHYSRSISNRRAALGSIKRTRPVHVLAKNNSVSTYRHRKPQLNVKHISLLNNGTAGIVRRNIRRFCILNLLK